MTDTQERDYSESEAVTDNTTETPEKDYSQEDDTSTTEPEYIDKKRHKEIVHGKETELQKARNLAIEAVYKTATTTDASILLEVHKDDPKLAKAVAERIDRSQSEFGTYENFLKGKQVVKSDDDFDTKYERRRKQEIHEDSIKKAHKVLDKLPDDLREEALEYFEDITEGKTLNEDKALKYAEMASIYVNKDKVKKEDRTDVEKKVASTNLPKGTTPDKTEDKRVWSTKLNKLILSSNN